MTQWSENRISHSLGIFWVQWNISLDCKLSNQNEMEIEKSYL